MNSLCFTVLISSSLFSLPIGLDVRFGDALCESRSNEMQLTTSHQAVLEWQSFSIDSDESVTFVQPNERSSVLNRVIGDVASQILGRLKSNGLCLLINQNGVVFGQHSQIDTQSLIASTFDLQNELFLQDRQDWSFQGTGAHVFHHGNIRAKESVYLFGKKVGIFDEATIDVPSGSVMIGGTPHSEKFPSADAVYFSPKASICVDAPEIGNGGEIILWGKELNQAYGALSARGGKIKGDGGTIEVSSLYGLDFQGTFSALATNGATGHLLLDPLDLTINGADAFVTAATPFMPTAGSACAPGPGNALLSTATLTAALAGGDVIVQTSGTVGPCPGILLVDGDITWAMGTNLTLHAADFLIIQREINPTGDGSVVTLISDSSDIVIQGIAPARAAVTTDGFYPPGTTAVSVQCPNGSFTINSALDTTCEILTNNPAGSGDVRVNAASIDFTADDSTGAGSRAGILTRRGDAHINVAGAVTLIAGDNTSLAVEATASIVVGSSSMGAPIDGNLYFDVGSIFFDSTAIASGGRASAAFTAYGTTPGFGMVQGIVRGDVTIFGGGPLQVAQGCLRLEEEI